MEAPFSGRREPRTETFVANISMLAAGLFALVIMMQGSASLILSGCLR